MRRIWLWLWLLMKRQLKSPAVLLFLLGIPLVSLVISSVPSMAEGQTPRVGLVAEGDDETAKRTMERLIGGRYSVDFYDAHTQKELSADLLSGETQHGYVFSEGLTQRLDSKKLKGSILLLQSESGFLPAMTKEIVFAEMYRVYGLNIALNYVSQSDLFAAIRPNALEMVRQKYEKYSLGSKTFHLDFEALDSAGVTEKLDTAGMVFPVRGVLAVLVFIAALYGGVWWKMDAEEGLFLALPSRLVKAGRFLYIFVPAFLFAVSAECTLALTHTGIFPYELLKMGGYIVITVLFTAMLTLFLPDSRWMVSVIPVFAIASLVLCPVFINLTEVLPGVRYLCRFLMPYYYL